MLKLSKLGFPTTMGIPYSSIPHSISHEKVEKKKWTHDDADRFRLKALASTENQSTMVPILVIEIVRKETYLCAIKDITTGLYIIRSFTKNPQKVSAAHHGCHTSLCPSYDSQWCVDINDEFMVPDWFWKTLVDTILPQ